MDSEFKTIQTPITDEIVNNLKVGDLLYLSGDVFCGRDTVLPKIVETQDGEINNRLAGSVIFHTAVSPAGVGPTSSNKLEIENSMIPLSKKGVKIHLGKGRISDSTISALEKWNSVFAVIPPVTALLNANIVSKELFAYSELGMEAFYHLIVKEYPIIVAAAHGQSIFNE